MIPNENNKIKIKTSDDILKGQDRHELMDMVCIETMLMSFILWSNARLFLVSLSRVQLQQMEELRSCYMCPRIKPSNYTSTGLQNIQTAVTAEEAVLSSIKQY